VTGSRHRLREVFGLELLATRDLAVAWGYPRAIDEQELLLGHWFRYGPLVFWLVGDAKCQAGELGLHLVIDPSHRSEIDRDEWYRVLCVLGDLIDADSFVFTSPDPKIEGLAARYGWTKRGERWYFSVHGPVRTEEAEAAPRASEGA
jgi:hypothetical protein